MHLPTPSKLADNCAPYYQLDGNPVIPAWRPTLSAALLEVFGNCSRADLVALKRLANFVSANQAELQANAKIAETASISPPDKSNVRHPVCTILLLRRPNRYVSPALDLLFASMCEAALEASSDLERRQIATLTSALRGALERAPNSRLQILLGDSRTLAEVHGRLEEAFSTREKQPTLASHWRSWFGARIQGWLLRDRARLRKALEPADLVPPIDAPAITILRDVEGDPDDTLDAPVASTVQEPGEKEIPSFDAEKRRARANKLERASEGDLFSDPDWYLPVELIRKIATGALDYAQRHLADGEHAEAESYAALALAVATGLRDSDLADLRWATHAPTDTAGKVRPAPRLDIDRPLMYWPVIRPPSARCILDPSPAMERAVDVLEWPLPPKVHRLMRALCGNAPRSGACTFPSHERGENLPLALHDVVTRICPGLFAGAGVIRRAMASELARALGPDVAQLTLADAFSHSVAPTYYAAPRVSTVTSAICSIHTRWFGESADVGNPGGCFGSRIIPTDQASREWPSSLHAKRRSAAHRKQGAIDGWVAHRNFLAGSLASATGHRPVDSIGQIDIHDVIPERGLIVLRDKQIDPLRRIRVAATGSLWTCELRDYLDRLVDLSQTTAEPRLAKLAADVLRGDAPLFSAPAPTGYTFDSVALVATMPEAFKKVRNHYRHRLNQQMLWRLIDPELRFAQMGWVIGPAYFTADLSPSAATDLAQFLGPTIDEILIDDGWFSSGRRSARWRWDGIPMPPMRDWDSVAAEHVKDHKEDVKRLREAWIERGKETEVKILPRLAGAIRTVLPRLRLDEQARLLAWAPEYHRRDPVEVDAEHCELMLNIVRTQDDRSFEALETATTRILLHRLLKKSHRQGMTEGVLAGRPIFSATAEPSPFLEGSGCAVRHADCIRNMLMDRIRAKTTRDQGILAALSVLCFSPYRDIDRAQAAVEAAAGSRRAKDPGDWLRVPATIDGRSYPMALNGVAALLLAQRGSNSPTAHAPTDEKINAWLKDHLPSELSVPDGMTPLNAIAGTLRAAGRLEVSGQERLLMLNGVKFAAAPVDRCLAVDDRWPVQTREATAAPENEPLPSAVLTPEAQIPPPHNPTPTIVQYKQLFLPLLNPDTLPIALGKSSDSRYGLRNELVKQLETLRVQLGKTSSVGLLTGFALHLIKHGGKKGPLREVSVHTDVTRFAGDMLAVLGDRALLDMDSAQLRTLYLAVLFRKTKKGKPESVGALEMFHQYLEDVFQVDEVPFDELKRLVGRRIRDPDPGILTDAEIDAVCNVLEEDMQREYSGVDASPEFRRLAELRLVLFILAEASGLRPASVRGLLLGDLHLLAEGRDFAHVHRTGSFGSAKTSMSIGFVPLEGHLWTRKRTWVLEWLARERSRVVGDRAWQAPLFAHRPGSARKFSKTLLGQRLGQLLRWVTDDGKARLYWCRKRRIRVRHARLAEKDGVHLAREVHATLNVSGHAGITTPLESYICDPAVPMARSLRESRYAPRADILAATNLKAEPLDVEWGRKGGADGKRRMEIVFARLPFAPAASPMKRLTTPPSSPRQQGLLPMHIDLYARALHKDQDRELAVLKASLSMEQADAVDVAAKELLAMRGQVPWQISGVQHLSAVMKVARRLEGSRRLFKALDSAPSPGLQRFSALWAQRRFSHRVVEAGLLLASDDEVALARSTMNELGFDDRQIVVDGSGSDRAITLARTENADKNSQRQRLISALEWVLSMVWIQQKALSAAKTNTA